MKIVITERSIKLKAKTIGEFLSKCSYVPEDIKNAYKDGDEIWHFNDFGIAPKKCEREAVLLVREGEFIKAHLIKCS